jgi:crotonobetainyl-CoA:carnitine CoA-transferase CaiB-like acyl-CoA transferase
MELTRILQHAGLEAFPALKPEDLVVDPQLRARGFLLDTDLAGDTIVLPGSPLHGLAEPAGPTPMFGEHTASILAEIDLIATPHSPLV